MFDNLQNIMCANVKFYRMCEEMDYDCKRVFLRDGRGLGLCMAAISNSLISFLL